MKLMFENPVACTNCVNCVIVYDIVDDYGYKRFDQEMEFSGTEAELHDRIQQLKYMGAYDIEVVGEPGIYESLNEKYFPDIYQCSIDGQKYNIEWDEKSGKYRAPVRLAKKYVYGATAEDVMDEIDRVVAEYFTESKKLKEDRVKHYHYGNSPESKRKEISDRFGKPFTPDDHMIVCKDGKTINIQIGKKYKCTSFYGQRVEVVDIEDFLSDGTAMLDVAWRNKRYAVASTQIYESFSNIHENINPIDIIKQNYEESGTTDNDGIYRYISGGNTIYILHGKNGWAFRMYGKSGRLPLVSKFSIRSDGRYKNGGKIIKSSVVELDDYFKNADKYAIITPKEESEHTELNWIDCSQYKESFNRLHEQDVEIEESLYDNDDYTHYYQVFFKTKDKYGDYCSSILHGLAYDEEDAKQRTVKYLKGKGYTTITITGIEELSPEDTAWLDDMLDMDYTNWIGESLNTEHTKRLNEQAVEIEVKHEGILEVPEGKNVEDLPISHFVDLAKKKGLSKITKALNNLQVWNKKKNPELSKWAGDMIDKVSKRMENQEKKESIIRNSRINESGRPFDCVTDAVDYYYRNWVNGFVSNEEIRMDLKKKHYSDDFIDNVFETISDRYEDEERYDYEHDYD